MEAAAAAAKSGCGTTTTTASTQHQIVQLQRQDERDRLRGGLGRLVAGRLAQEQQQPHHSLQYLDVVRALHQTVKSLRSELEREKSLHIEKSSPQQQKSQTYNSHEKTYVETLERLALENHALRRRLIDRFHQYSKDAATSPPASERSDAVEPLRRADKDLPKPEPSAEAVTVAPPPTEAMDATEAPRGDEKDEAPPVEPIPEAEQDDDERHRTSASEKLSGQGASNESENESEELDDIELIFTTDETCRDVGLQEDLVSITDADHWQQQQDTAAPAQKSLLKMGQARSADSATTGCNGDQASADVEAASSQSSSIEREESVDRFDESSSGKLNKLWSQCSVLVETDISKCGVLEEADLRARRAARRNTLAAPPTAYRPIIHREALAAGRRKSAAPLRPVLDSRAPAAGARRESGAQTDISALPAQWRSESYLAHKVAHAFTTLPSKFALPAGVPGRLRLSDKTREARRVMLSDIGFTSMVPELSRSADHLCQDPHARFPHCHAPDAAPCATLRTPESSRREVWARSGALSPCDCRLSADLCPSRHRGSSLSSIASPGAQPESRRHSWRPNVATSFDGWRGAGHAVAGHRHRHAAGQVASSRWSSVPSSPTHVQPPSAALLARLTDSPPKRTSSKVTFQDCPMTRGSLPNLRSELLGENSGDSTESLIDEAEDYLRRSIDSMLTFSSAAERCLARHSSRHRRCARRHSEPDLFREWNPPQSARPYLPKTPRDLKPDHLVKVISPEGKILQGRVRYVGTVAGREDVHVGVELPRDCGSSNGTFHGGRYFECETDRAVFVPFKKVVLAWCTT